MRVGAAQKDGGENRNGGLREFGPLWEHLPEKEEVRMDLEGSYF